jgi:hypothetical protein
MFAPHGNSPLADDVQTDTGIILSENDFTLGEMTDMDKRLNLYFLTASEGVEHGNFCEKLKIGDGCTVLMGEGIAPEKTSFHQILGERGVNGRVKEYDDFKRVKATEKYPVDGVSENVMRKRKGWTTLHGTLYW